jgi:hypothetical protein
MVGGLEANETGGFHSYLRLCPGQQFITELGYPARGFASLRL